MDVLLTAQASYVTRDLVNRGGEPAKIALGLLKLTVPIAVRRRVPTLMLRADAMFKQLKASRLDNSTEAEMRRLAQVRLLIVDDLALQPMDDTATADFYELVVARHQKAATVVTSNRGPDNGCPS